LILGGLFLFDSASGNGVYGPSVRVSLWVLGIVSGTAAAIVGWLVWEMRRSSSEEEYVQETSHEALIGQTAVVTRALDPSGEVLVSGEHWQADVTEGLVVDSGASVVIHSVEGLRLGVELADQATQDEES
jgi:membrane protein implicated in regulation of membrane protease activity